MIEVYGGGWVKVFVFIITWYILSELLAYYC